VQQLKQLLQHSVKAHLSITINTQEHGKHVMAFQPGAYGLMQQAESSVQQHQCSGCSSCCVQACPIIKVGLTKQRKGSGAEHCSLAENHAWQADSKALGCCNKLQQNSHQAGAAPATIALQLAHRAHGATGSTQQTSIRADSGYLC
jgi:hypothetical protein